MIDDEMVPPNDTLGAVLRRCEDGDAWNYVGGELQKLQADLLALAKRKGGDAKGTLTLTLKLHMGRDGYQGVTADVVTKKPKVQRLETTMPIGEDGEVLARPVEKQLSLREVSAPAAAERKAI